MCGMSKPLQTHAADSELANATFKLPSTSGISRGINSVHNGRLPRTTGSGAYAPLRPMNVPETSIFGRQQDLSGCRPLAEHLSLDIHIPQSVVDELQAEARAKRSESNRLAREAEEIERNFEAIRVLKPEMFPATVVHVLRPTAAVPSEPKKKTLGDVIVQVLEEATRPLAPSEIRRALTDKGMSDMLNSENYLYTALKRLIDHGRVVKFGDGYTSPKRLPEAEASALPQRR